MKSRNLLTLSFAALLPLALAAAQLKPILRATIPFEFRVGTVTLPSGEYIISEDQTNETVTIRSDDTQKSAMLLSHPVQKTRVQNESRLVFNRYGDTYFLSQLWVEGASGGRELNKTKTERELAESTEMQVASVPARR